MLLIWCCGLLSVFRILSRRFFWGLLSISWRVTCRCRKGLSLLALLLRRREISSICYPSLEAGLLMAGGVYSLKIGRARFVKSV